MAGVNSQEYPLQSRIEGAFVTTNKENKKNNGSYFWTQNF
jgi:hypothetical protein